MARLSRGQFDRSAADYAEMYPGSGGGSYDPYDVNPSDDLGLGAYASFLEKPFYGPAGSALEKGYFRPGTGPRPPGIPYRGNPLGSPLGALPDPFTPMQPGIPAWGKVGALPGPANNYGYDFVGAGFQLYFDCGEPGPAGYVRKIGWNPTNPAVPTFCANGDHTANAPIGETVPRGTLFVQLVAQHDSLPWPDESGVSFKGWRWPSGAPGSTSEVPNHGQKTLPTGWSSPGSARAPMSNPDPVDGPEGRRTFRRGVLHSTDIKFSTQPDPTNGVPGDGKHTPTPPARGEKEKKFQLGKAGIVGDTFGQITEILDFADCLVDAIKSTGVKVHANIGPSRKNPLGKSWTYNQYRSPKGMQAKSDFIARNFDISNPAMIAASLRCMALQHLEDLGVGMLSSKAGRAFGQASGAARGVGIKRPPNPYESSKSSAQRKEAAPKRYGVSTRMR